MDPRVRSWSTELARTVRQLEESSGRRIARRNARAALKSLLARIERALFKEHPAISKAGKEWVPAEPLPAGQKNCPVCDTYCGTYVKLARHVFDVHKVKHCWCGTIGMRRKAGAFGTDPCSSKLRAHFRGLIESGQDLKTHALMGAIGRTPAAAGTPERNA